ncbi:hypothetical protein DSM14862_04181 (plasmid) [Sulfitobacter indolifex]|uniref:Cation efflux system protein n=1 Tax=Sulfitobacter indolifex HEL-45 TaxID=391624 RepID=A0ABP2D780_9RHOB|nr:cation efflux system protein [Sulfitobacter indolifex HEL-45]UOA21341.1 hypothetical protein DSM14862_04181 [Sulfitobacter indolifex]
MIDPPALAGWTVVILGGVALVVDTLTALLTYSMQKGSVNIRALFLHNLSDALASVAVIFGGTLIIFYDLRWVDHTTASGSYISAMRMLLRLATFCLLLILAAVGSALILPHVSLAMTTGAAVYALHYDGIGPILGAILTASAASATVSKGVWLLAIGAVGRCLHQVAGGVMVLMGIGMMTGQLSAFS